MPSRRLHSFISSFLDYTTCAPSPEIFRLWAGLTGIAAALSRRVWVKTRSGPIYPGTMTILCGKSGIGKSPAINPMEHLLRAIDFSHNPALKSRGIRMGVQRITASGLFDLLSSPLSTKTLTLDTEKFLFQNAVFIVAEASTLLSELKNGSQGAELGAYLVKFLDGELMDRKLKSDEGESIEIPQPSGSILAGLQPKLLLEYFPESAWDMGFAARGMFVFSDEHVGQSMFGTDIEDEDDPALLNSSLEPDLIHDLEQIAEMSGLFRLSKEAMILIDRWWNKGKPTDVPDHPMLQSYGAKRNLQLIRLCMITSASRSNDLRIIDEDVQLALHVLHDAEKRMPDLFSTVVKADSDEKAIDQLIHAIRAYMAFKGEPMPEVKVRTALGSKISRTDRIDTVLDEMINRKLIKRVRSKNPNPLVKWAYKIYDETVGAPS